MVERGDSMQRVVVTGSGVVSSIGVGKDAVCASLRAGYSGMRFLPEMAALGYRCCVYAPVVDVGTGVVPRRWLRTVSAAGTYAVVAALEALDDAALDCERLDKSVDPNDSASLWGPVQVARTRFSGLRTIDDRASGWPASGGSAW